MNRLVSALENENNTTITEKGAATFKSTKNHLLDYFYMGSSLRTRSPEDKYSMFKDAWNENKELALRTLFYSRDVRKGQGERQSFRDILFYLLQSNEIHQINVPALLGLISEYGRWDDLIELCVSESIPSPVALIGAKLIRDQIAFDLGSKHHSLLGKWLPSINASASTRKKAFTLISLLNVISESAYTLSSYRKMCSTLRKKIGIVESAMTSGKWSEINFERVPSKASLLYRKAFHKHDEVRYAKYLKDVSEGKKKINASVLYPYDVVRELIYPDRIDDDYAFNTLEALWKSLPNYIEDSDNSIVVADVSGSMYPFAITVSISLALYIAERNRGAFHNKFLTFSSSPTIEEVKGNSIAAKVEYLKRAKWGGTTNLQATFDLLLDLGKKNKVPVEDMPTTIYVISDMEFDTATSEDYWSSHKRAPTNFEEIKRKYEANGYPMPRLVFWNVEARNSQTPVTVDDSNVILVGGCSPSILKNVLAKKDITAESVMLETIMDKRYDPVAKVVRL